MNGASIGKVGYKTVAFNTTSSYKVNNSTNIGKVNYNYEEINDYNHYNTNSDTEVNLDNTNNKNEENADFSERWNAYWDKKFQSSMQKNTIFYTMTGLASDPNIASSIIRAMGISMASSTSSTLSNYLNTVAVSGISKSVAALVVGGDVGGSAFEGILKKAQTEAINKRTNIRDDLKNIFSKVPDVDEGYVPQEQLDEVIEEVANKNNVSKLSKIKSNIQNFNNTVFGGETKASSKAWIKDRRFLNTSSSGGQYFEGINAGGMLSAIGIDYIASVGVNIGKSLIDGKGWSSFKIDNAKYGSALLKSSWKTACSKAFSIIGGAIGGPAGKNIGTIVGNVVGAEIGNFCTDVLFDGDEEWCAAAGVATAVGATAGGVIVTALAVGGAFATVPVAGWAVGGAIILGAIIGTGVTALVKFCVDRE